MIIVLNKRCISLKLIIGYARRILADKNLDRQIYELENFGCEKIITEKQSVRNLTECSIYNEMHSKLCFGDILVVHDLS